jgi:hypothetical protein
MAEIFQTLIFLNKNDQENILLIWFFLIHLEEKILYIEKGIHPNFKK